MEELELTYYGVQIHLVAAADTTLCSRLQQSIPSQDPLPAAAEPASVSYSVTASPSLDTAEQTGYTIARDGSAVLSDATEEEVEAWLWHDVDLTIAARSPNMLFVHAGVVGWRGLALVIPGRGRTGKSTLVAELVRRGAVYYSDTFAVMDEAGLVHPYARPLTVGAERRTPPDLRLEREVTMPGPLPIALSVAGAYQPERAWRPTIVRGARAVWPLFTHMAPIRDEVLLELRDPAKRLIRLAGRMAATMVTLHGPWAEAADVAAHLLALVDDALVSHASAALSNGARSLSEDLACVAELRVGSVAPQPARPISRAPAAKRLVAIVTPVHRFPLTADEQISLRHLREYLGHFDRYLIGPHTPPDELSDFATPPFQTRYFADRPGYSRLLMTEQFYRTFADYEYILIYQLDCLVFSDKLEWWCRQGWDYIGAPWFDLWHPHQYANLERSEDPVDRFGTVGNGGFSLRKVESALAVLNSPKRRIDDRLVSEFLAEPEDLFWSLGARELVDEFRIPGARQALEFAIEIEPGYFFEENFGRLPFGCHAWNYYDREFWEPYLLK